MERVTLPLNAADAQPLLGRPAGSAADTVARSDRPAQTARGIWALLLADFVDLAGSSRVRSIPLDPPAHVPGCDHGG